MKTLKSAAESIIRRCRGTGHRTKLIKRPAIIILIAIMIITSVLSPSGLTLGSGGLSPVPVKAAGAEDGTSSGEADNAESSTGSAREETGNTDADASESEGEKEDKDNTASDVKKGGNDAASQDQGGDTGIAEDAGKGDHEEKSGSANGSSDKKNNETKDAAADSDKSGKKGNEAAGAGSGENNTSKDSGSGRKNSSDRDNVNENGTEGTTAPENDEIILTETARDKSYTITVRGDKYSGLKNVDKMTVLEITKDDQFYEEFVKKLNKTLNKTTEGQIQDIRLYDIEFTDQNGLPVHLKRNVDVTITYNNYKASPKVEMNQVVRAFIATTVTYYGFFTNVTTSFAKAYASGAGARVSRKGMTGNTAAADRQIKISKTEWIDEKEILTDISRNRVNEVTYILPKDGVTGIAVIGKDPEIRKPEQGQTEDKGETATEAQTADKIEAGKEAKPEDKSETATETQPEDKSEAATEAQPGDKSEAGKENQPEGENGDGQDSQTGTQKEENSEARTADQTQTSPETQTADQIQTGPEAQTGDQNEAGQETQPEKTLTVKGKDYRVTVTYDDKAGLPEGARLTAREIGDYSRSYKNYLSQAESALTKDKQVNTARFFDITIWDGAGNKIEPKAPVRVSIEFDSVDVQDKGNVELIHFEADKKNAGAGSGKVQILHDVEVQDGEKKDTVDGVSFDIGGFSVFGVLQTVQVLKMTASDGKQYKVTVTYDDTCGIPADAKLIVNEISKTDKRYNDYVDKTAETLGKDAGQFSYAHALDIMLVGQVTGKHYQPTKDVKVSIELLKEDISEDQDVNVVHFQGDEKNTASRMDSKVDEGSVEFETDGFSVYVIVQTFKKQILTASDGKSYKVTVEYDNTCGIPTDAELEVSELDEKDPYYTEYVEKTAKTLGKEVKDFAFAHALDIKLVDKESGEKYQPTKDVKVNIDLLTEELEEKADVSVVHFKGDIDRESAQDKKNKGTNTKNLSKEDKEAIENAETEVLDTTVNKDGIVEFTSDAFSVYVVTYTVDFHWGDYTYSMEGYSEVPLSTVLNQLFIDQFTIQQVSNVSFSDPNLLSVTKTESDWVLKSLAPFDTEETLTITLDNDNTCEIKVRYEQDEEPTIIQGEGEAFKREFIALEGNWANWKVTVNEAGRRLNGGRSLTLKDTFDDGLTQDARQSIDYGSISVTGHGVTYDYSDNTGTYIIPDETPVTIAYRTRISAKAGQRVTFRGTALLQYGNVSIDSTAGIDEGVVIYPSASDAAGFGSNYMVKMYVYGDKAMQTGIGGVKFILMDESQRPLEYKLGENKGQPVTFITGEDGYVNIELHEEKGDVAIEKNTGYYLEMIQGPEGYQKDNTLYSFMITDDPSYNTGSFYQYYNGDTMKVRLYDAVEGLTVSLRFSGSYTLTDEQKDNVTAVLQKRVGENWEEVERHPYTDTKWGYITFSSRLSSDDLYRVIEENARPWDLPDEIRLSTSYYCIINDCESPQYSEPHEFFMNSGNNSVNVVIDNRYEEAQLTITKMNKSTGEALTGAEFEVFKIKNGTQEGDIVKSYTTDSKGKLVIRGGEPYESEVLYGIKETGAPAGYLLPQTANWRYFYFCNDTYLEPTILANLPEGAEAINLSTSGDMVSLDNQKERITIPVMKIWQGNTWPDNVDSVTVGLYKSVNGADPESVTDGSDARTLVLTKADPYNNTTFIDLPSRDEDGNDITYSIKEEIITVGNVQKTPLEAGYVQEYGVSDAGVYVVRNKPSTSLTIGKEWYDRTGWAAGNKITDETTLKKQLPVTFDVYRTTSTISDDIKEDGITHEEMTAFLNGAKKVRESLTLNHDGNWNMTISDLDRKDDAGQPYNYYVLENIPSFGDELYEVNETNGIVTIKNKIAPNPVKLIVTKEALVNDPRPESADTEFGFTLTLMTEDNKHPIRSWKAGTVETTETIENSETGETETNTRTKDLVTDWEGQVTFKLKPEHSLALALPEGVKATVTESYNPEYTVKSKFNDGDDSEGRSYSYNVSHDTENATLTYTNTLRVVCKVVNDTGTEIPYETIKSALNRLRNPEVGESFSSPWTVYMIEDYDIPATDIVNVGEDESLTLTTASITDSLFPFKGGQETDRATITRAANGGSIITNAGHLSLKNIVLDGNKDNYTATTDGGLVNSSNTLNLNNKAELRNSASSGTGGAVYAAGTVNMTDGDDGAIISGNRATSASALYLSGALNMSCGTISRNLGASDGAVVVSSSTDRIYLSGASKIIENTGTEDSIAANLYIGYDSDNIVNVTGSGLLAAARIGITAKDGHMEIGEQFATTDFGVTDYLSSFINDKYGYKGKLKDGTSTNVVWDGLTMNIKKRFEGEGTNPYDTFTITISSRNLNRSSYVIDGTLDYTVKPASGSNQGSIVLRKIKAGDDIRISPLPVGEYSITENSSSGSFNYEPAYSVITEANDPISVNDGTFITDTDCNVTVTNTRRKANVKLTKSLDDQLATGSVDFPFTIKLTEQDGTPIKGFTLANGTETDDSGEAKVTFSPSNTSSDVKNYIVPVGALMTITEMENSNYRVTVSAKTMPSEGQGDTIDDGDADNDTVFVIPSVTDNGANVTFRNKRKSAGIELRKVLENKVSTTESFTFELTLTNSDGTKASGYTLYQDKDHPENNIVTNENGVAEKVFRFGEGESSKSVLLSVPEGSKLEVEETEATRTNGATEEQIDLELFDTSKKVNGQTPILDLTPRKHTFNPVTDSDWGLEFTNARKTKTITVTNTVNGYSGNTQLFTYTATVTDGAGNDYDANGFTDGVQTFELATGQSRELVVPLDASLTVAEPFIVGYETSITRGGSTKINELEENFTVKSDQIVAFTNTQLIKLLLVNQTSSKLDNVQVYNEYSNVMYRVNADGTGQDPVTVTNKWATVDVESGKTAILMVRHPNSVTDSKNYTVKGTMPADGYYYTIKNEPSFHEYADPAVMRVYGMADFEVKGKLRYSVSDSTVTFSEQPLVSFDVNGGFWTTDMEDYHDRDGDRQVYQKAVNSGETVSRPDPDPVYPTAEGIKFLGWTTEEEYAKQDHSNDTDIDPEKSYDFDTPVDGPVTLYAVWKKAVRDKRVVTLKNSTGKSLNVSLTLTNSSQVGNIVLADGVITDLNGKVDVVLPDGEAKNLFIPDGTKLVLDLQTPTLAVSSQYTVIASNDKKTFTINSVKRDGTITFIAGICKITDSADNILYRSDGTPAVYQELKVAFTDYNGILYTDASRSTAATQAKVKILIDEYAISESHTFPNKDVILTTAGKEDQDFPYVGIRDRATLYRADSYSDGTLFTKGSSDTASKVTLTDIILDGKEVKLAKAANGGLIYLNNTGATLNIEEGTTLRNVQYSDYSDSNNSRGGAIYVQGGILNVKAGLFKNLHARRGGAICSMGSNSKLNITGQNGSTRFEDCYAETEDGGAVFYGETPNNDLTIDGGENNGVDVGKNGDQWDETLKDSPGIIFIGCQAKSKDSDGGAIYANTNNNKNIVIKGCAFTECSAKNERGGSDSGFGGGAICAKEVKMLTVSYCSFNSCDTLKSGGAIVALVKSTTNDDEDTFSVSNCTFANCSCKAQGGALAVYTNDYKTAKSSKTKLKVYDSTIKNCSSGTDNGSGGAIQCYLPVMDFNTIIVSDCWAGKEGGAINNYYGNSYTDVWQNSKMDVTDCRFIRCRAEDRYDPEALQHYGGGINTKAKTAKVSRSYFEECVSTLKEGGALHLGGQNTGSKATVERTTFMNCMAKNGGGALLSSHETLEIDECNFYGCSSSASNGGAIYHYQNSRGSSTQKDTTIKNSTFSKDPNSSESSGCSAALNGGAIWTRATTNVTLENLTIQNAVAGANGGGVYLNSTTTEVKITGGSITGCQAVIGSAVYVGNKATFTSAVDDNGAFTEDVLNISNNIVSNVNDGAIHGGTLYFEGNVKVEDNTCSSDSTYDHDVLMQNDKATTIYTTSAGLGVNANIGVYVPDNYFNKRGVEGKAFGTYNSTTHEGSNYLESFFNDRDGELFGYQMSADDYNIYWGNFVCKITDSNGNTLTRPNGRDAVYPRLTQAFDEFNQVTGGDAKYVKMLVEDYNIRQPGEITNFPNADIILTTALRSDTSHPYRGTEGTVCTISRTSGSTQLFKLNNSNATFKLENITLDGRNDKSAMTGNRRLIEVAAGALIINSGTIMQYGVASNGGAIEAASNATVTINGSYDTKSEKPTVSFINCSLTGNKPNGGAIRAYNLTITNDSNTIGRYGTSFINCSAYNGGAITSLGSTMSIEGVFFDGCKSQSAGGAIYHNKWDSNSSTTVINCAFVKCMTTNVNNWAHGGAIEARTETLSVEDCSFTDCQATSDGGAVYHGFVDNNNKPSGNRVETSIKNTTFEGCSTRGTDGAYNFGGSVYTQARTVEVIGSSFKNSTATNHGGAIYCQCSITGSSATIYGTSFENCSTSRSTGGDGGAIYCLSKMLTLQDYTPEGSTKKTGTTISACIATQYSGAVHMETSNSQLEIKGKTKISGCYAKKGGAIYLKETVTMNLTGSPEFTNNGYTIQNGSVVDADEGACIYLAEGSRINLSGSPKFSRNILPNDARITNGGVLDNVRQDIYLAGYESRTSFDTNAASIYVTDKLTVDKNMIWVWPEKSPHMLPNEQFAKIGESNIDDDSLSCLRNALADSITGCTNGEYLAGVRIGNDTQNIYWDKMYTVSFKKRDNKAVGVPGAEFTLYKDKECQKEVASAKSIDGNSQRKGTVDFTSIPIGAYYMKETEVPVSFKENNATYLVLVGTPYLSKNDISRALWVEGGPLDVPDAEIFVPRLTTDANKHYGIFPLDENGKAVLRANLASSTVGIENIRSDYQVYFMKVDSDGNALPGAAFTIYSQMMDADGEPDTFDDGYPKLMRWSRDGESYPDPVKSADGTKTYKDINNDTLEKGTVYFRELPLGTYYLLETEYPERNGNNRRTYYVESDRVFRLVVRENNSAQITWELSEWHPKVGNETPEDQYTELQKNESGLYEVSNEESVCKLTDSDNHLLYVEGHQIWDNENSSSKRLFPAVYPTLETGFAAAQSEKLVNANGATVADDENNPSLKLQVLKDLTLTQPVSYTSPRDLIFTTASTKSKDADRYVFSTTRTSDTARAEIKRGYTEHGTEEEPVNGALITINNSAHMTLTNIKLNGMKTAQAGRALHVVNGTLDVDGSTLLHDFKQTAASSDGSVHGGAILMENGTNLNINGGSNRSVVFSGNEVIGGGSDAEGGAIALGDNCTVGISNAQFTGNNVQASGENAGNGGAISLGNNINLTLTNGVFTSNTAVMGSAVHAGKKTEVTIINGSIKGNKASGENGGAINLADDEDLIANNFAKIYLEGSPVIYDNIDNSGNSQRNIVLNSDSNGVINTTGSGLGEKAKIGVYVIDGENLFDKHGKAELPFGTFNNTDKNRNHPEIFHNDRDTKLYGVLSKSEKESDDDYYIIHWSAPEGSRKVILRKVASGTYTSLAGAQFEISTSPGGAPASDKVGTPLKNLISLDSGVFYVGELNYGTYYVKETQAPTSPAGYNKPADDHYFIITIDDEGVGYKYTEGETEKISKEVTATRP